MSTITSFDHAVIRLDDRIRSIKAMSKGIRREIDRSRYWMDYVDNDLEDLREVLRYLEGMRDKMWEVERAALQ